METFATWFGLREGRKDFFIQSSKDFALYFARADINSKIKTIIDESNRGQNPLKLVLYGDWGCGKTHTLRHLEFLLTGNEQFQSHVVFVELPDIRSDTTFHDAQALLLDALGLDHVKSWILKHQVKYGANLQDDITSFTQSEDIAKALLTLIGFGDSARVAWDWLRGLNLSASDARSVGLPPKLQQSHYLANVLRVFGKMSLEHDGAMLTYIIDEADKLRAVTRPDSVNHWKNTFRILSDVPNQECGLVIAGMFGDIEEMPEMLADEQIVTRFTRDHYLMLPTFQKDEAKTFLRDLLNTWIDPDKKSALIVAYGSEAGSEELSDSSYPFTERGLEYFAVWCCRNGNITRPRDIQGELHAALNKIMDREVHVISEALLVSLNN